MKKNSEQGDAQWDEQVPLRVMSFNIRLDTPHDGLHAWPYRKDRVFSLLRFHRPDIIGLQEVRGAQLADLEASLSGFAWLGVGRDDGREAGEFAAIFYRLERLELLDQGNFWLSKTPDVPGSINWKACCIRIVTWAKFLDRLTGQVFFLFNTHFDQASKKARRKSASLLLERLPAIAADAPLIVTGDLNCGEHSKPYHILTQGPFADGGHLQDAKVQSLTPHYGPTATFHAFTGILRSRIDYIFVVNGIRVLQHATLTDHWGGRYPSDHYPVIADMVVNQMVGCPGGHYGS